ncbi:MAG: type IX secretion system outer membrane channel protein PorV [Bacteroidales bacterium]|jgi:hypothetical protein|nr:type IX secretion system outer membrane channel protein PorV [Bacteroidales bacterium]
MKLSNISIVALYYLFTTFPLFGQQEVKLNEINSVRTAVPFLTIAPDSRSSAMGDVGVATTPDVNSQHWNPAKFVFMEKGGGVALSYSPWLRNLVDDMNLLYLTGYKRIDKFQTLSASLRYFDMGNITFRDDNANYLKEGRPNEFAIDLAYSRRFSDKLSAALAFRYIRSDISSGIPQAAGAKAKAGNSFAADVSMYYHSKMEIAGKKGEWAVGANISNIGSKMSYTNEQEKTFIPINLRIGGSAGIYFDDYNKITLAIDLNKLLVPTPPIRSNSGSNEILEGKDPNVGIVQGMFQSFYDAPGGFSEEMKEITYGFGLEYFYRNVFAVRAGYMYEHPTKGNRKYFSMGVGLVMNVFEVDFSYLIPTYSGNPLANTLRFSLVFNFGQKATS